MPIPDWVCVRKTNGQSNDLEALLGPISAPLTQVRRRIEQTLSKSVSGVGDGLIQLGLGGGKMLRPALVLLSGGCIGSLRAEHIELGAIVEMIHLASLLHDDVIDQAQTRRGRSSANTLWGNTQAVLLGDFVLSKAFGLGAAVELSGAATVLCQTAEAICTGEIQQNLRKGDWNLTEAEYLSIIEGKTASLFGACCYLGGLAAEAKPSVCESLRRYGVSLGFAFQMIDDLLDILGSPAAEGKTLGTDFLHEKLTLPVIHWLGQGDFSPQKAKLEKLLRDSDHRGLCDAINGGGSVDYTLSRAEEFAEQARRSLAEVPDGEAKETLLRLVSYVLHRF